MKKENKNKFFRGNVKDFSETKGYFVGQFMQERGFPLLATEEVEIAWKVLPSDFGEGTPHFHKRGVEINIVVSGSYKVCVGEEEIQLRKGDFLIVYPETRLRNISAQEGTELIVVKAPSVSGDKYEQG